MNVWWSAPPAHFWNINDDHERYETKHETKRKFSTQRKQQTKKEKEASKGDESHKQATKIKEGTTTKRAKRNRTSTKQSSIDYFRHVGMSIEQSGGVSSWMREYEATQSLRSDTSNDSVCGPLMRESMKGLNHKKGKRKTTIAQQGISSTWRFVRILWGSVTDCYPDAT